VPATEGFRLKFYRTTFSAKRFILIYSVSVDRICEKKVKKDHYSMISIDVKRSTIINKIQFTTLQTVFIRRYLNISLNGSTSIGLYW